MDKTATVRVLTMVARGLEKKASDIDLDLARKAKDKADKSGEIEVLDKDGNAYKKPDTRDEAYGVNSILALSGLAGMGYMNSDKDPQKRVGASLLMAPVVGGAAYHATRNLGGNATARLLSLILGYSGGLVGGRAISELV